MQNGLDTEAVKPKKKTQETSRRAFGTNENVYRGDKMGRADIPDCGNAWRSLSIRGDIRCLH